MESHKATASSFTHRVPTMFQPVEELIKYVLAGDCTKFKDVLSDWQELLNNDDLTRILRVTIKNTKNYSAKNIRERIEICELLNLDRKLINIVNNDTKSILHLPRIHVDILIHLIGEGVNIYAKTEDSETLMHICPSYLTSVDYHKLVSFIFERQLDSIFELQCLSGSYPLHAAVQHLEIGEETLKLLYQNKRLNAAQRDHHGRNIYAHANLHERSTEFLISLRQFGAWLSEDTYTHHELTDGFKRLSLHESSVSYQHRIK